MTADCLAVVSAAYLCEHGYVESSPFLCCLYRGDGSHETFRVASLRALRGIIRLLRVSEIGLSVGDDEDRAALWDLLHRDVRPANSALQRIEYRAMCSRASCRHGREA